MVDERTSANQERGQYRESTTSMFAARMRDADRAQRQRGGPCGAPRDAPGGPSGGTRRGDRPVPALRLCARHLGLRRVPHGCPALLDDRPLRQPQLRRPASRLLSPKSTAAYLIGHHPIKSANTTTCSKQAAATGEGEAMTMTLKTRLAEPGRLMSVHVCVATSAHAEVLSGAAARHRPRYVLAAKRVWSCSSVHSARLALGGIGARPAHQASTSLRLKRRALRLNRTLLWGQPHGVSKSDTRRQTARKFMFDRCANDNREPRKQACEKWKRLAGEPERRPLFPKSRLPVFSLLFVFEEIT